MPRNKKRNRMPKGVSFNINNTGKNTNKMEKEYKIAKEKVKAPERSLFTGLRQSLERMMAPRRTIKSTYNNNLKRALNSSNRVNNMLAESKNITRKHERSSSALARPINGRRNTEANTVRKLARQFLVKQAQNQDNERRKTMREMRYEIQRRQGKPASAAPAPSGQAAKALGLKVKKRKPSKKIKPSKKSKKSK